MYPFHQLPSDFHDYKLFRLIYNNGPVNVATFARADTDYICVKEIDLSSYTKFASSIFTIIIISC